MDNGRLHKEMKELQEAAKSVSQTFFSSRIAIFNPNYNYRLLAHLCKRLLSLTISGIGRGPFLDL